MPPRSPTPAPAPISSARARWRSSIPAPTTTRISPRCSRRSSASASLTAIATPGHSANHLCFALEGAGALFSGGHVMAWSTSVVAPPDGSMRDYMDSLEKLRGRDERTYWPGHGGPVRDPARYLRGLISHRRQREAAILARLEGGPLTVRELVEMNYSGLDPQLVGAAGLSTRAHLDDLIARGL